MNLLLNKIKELNANNRKLANEERERQMRETAKNMFGPEYLVDTPLPEGRGFLVEN